MTFCGSDVSPLILTGVFVPPIVNVPPVTSSKSVCVPVKSPGIDFISFVVN